MTYSIRHLVPQRKIGIVGAANLDVLAYPVSTQVFEKRTLPVRQTLLSVGGDALNEASVLAALGADVTLTTLICEDLAGKLLLNFCQENQIQLRRIKTSSCTGINMVLVEEDHERCFITNASSNIRQLSLDNIPDIQEDIVCLASLFVSYALPLSDAAALLRKWKESGKITAMDTTTAKHGETLADMARILPFCDYFFTNIREAQSFTGMSDPWQAVQALKQAGARNVLLKMGKEGVMVLHEKQIWISPVDPNDNCIDTTGCGDSFAAGFLYALSCGASFEQCLNLAKACGSLACEQVGATTAFRNLSGFGLMEKLDQLIDQIVSLR